MTDSPLGAAALPMEHVLLPRIIQGGMGAGISGWRLARAVSQAGQLGVVAGTALDLILARRLQMGDKSGHVRRALKRLPIPGVAARIIDRYWIEGGKAEGERFVAKPVPGAQMSARVTELLVAGNFVEVELAKEGHGGLVGINYLEKIQLPTLPSIYGAMLAGVNWVLMGAGIPIAIPEILDRLAQGLAVELPLDVQGAPRGERFVTSFDPASLFDGEVPQPARPRFVAIVSSPTVATALLRRASGQVDGFVVEGPTAGGHNAPPRGRPELTPSGEPTYGPRDHADPAAFVALGLPFWLAGSFGCPGGLGKALEVGATGVQVGTAFAYCAESDLREDLKARVLTRSQEGRVSVFTDPVASPTGFPFKVVNLPGTLSDAEVYERRKRICDLGYLRHAYLDGKGKVAWRCSAEPEADYVRKGGNLENTVGRKCVCNALMANLGMGQIKKDDSLEPELVTSGDAAATVASFLAEGAESYSAADVIQRLLADEQAPSAG
jgi:nitronate monooxygenase